MSVGNDLQAPLASANLFKMVPSAAFDGGGRRFFNRLGVQPQKPPPPVSAPGRPDLHNLKAMSLNSQTGNK